VTTLPTCQQFLLPYGLVNLPEIIDMAEQFK